MSMYTPRLFAIEERAAIARLMHDHPFATLVTPGASEAHVSHLPLLFVPDREPHGTLLGHMARANPHWEHARSAPSLAIFQGPHAYVSPSWYGEPAKAVPTWNYTAVHVSGTLEIIDDAAQTRQILDALVQRFEGQREAPWQFAMPVRERDALVAAIVAFRMRIHEVTAKFKLSQNRPPADRVRVADALEREGYADAAAVARWMRDYSR
ncbi:MAG TPA: FMN-binding negative transcriptional regulator [Casimicrobiaceae bacterium]|nr:FMN-binding negative transcriptional regulator [Casimicrobiaceae bacterium]